MGVGCLGPIKGIGPIVGAAGVGVAKEGMLGVTVFLGGLNIFEKFDYLPISNLEKYSELGLKACEIAFTYGVYIKNKEDAEKIGRKARELDIELSIHAPYWINLNSKEKKKIEVKLLWKKEFPEGIRHVGTLDEFPGLDGKPDKEPHFQRTVITPKAIYFLSPPSLCVNDFAAGFENAYFASIFQRLEANALTLLGGRIK